MKIGFIGAGNMSSAIVEGMLKADFNANSIYLNDINLKLLTTRKCQFGVSALDLKELAQNCNLIVLAVKPQNVTEVCRDIKDNINKDTIIISILAGITTNKLSKLLATNNIIRTMPNTPATIGLGASGIFSLIGKNDIVDKIFSSIGICTWVKSEKQLDIITALSGSGPAYFYSMFEAMIDTAVELGLDKTIAKKFCLQTAIGAAKMSDNQDIKALREMVTSKGGTTEKALATLESHNFKNILNQAMVAAHTKSIDLSSSN